MEKKSIVGSATPARAPFQPTAPCCATCDYWQQVDAANAVYADSQGKCLVDPPALRYMTVETVAGPREAAAPVHTQTVAANFCARHPARVHAAQKNLILVLDSIAENLLKIAARGRL